VLIKFSVPELAAMALVIWKQSGVTFDDVVHIGRDDFVRAYASERDCSPWAGACVPPTDAEIAAMYDCAVQLWAAELATVTVH